ncbi:MAG: RluA family pseudouridine synthase [Bacillota bacterium]
MIKTLTADRAARLDVLVAGGCGATRSQAAKWIAAGLCAVNGIAIRKAGAAVKQGDAIRVDIPQAAPLAVEKENIPVSILYQDADIAVIGKPYGMVVHPAGGRETGTLVNALLYALDGLSGIGGVMRPGIVHRLDKDTSGILLVAKNDQAHLSLSKQLKDRSIEKRYLAVVEGEMKEAEGLIDQPIGRSKRDRKKMTVTLDGRPSQTEWRVLERLRRATLLDVHILTGRTHQIRVHMRSVRHPVAGDPVYGLKGGVKVPRMMLHAHTLAFTHPRTGERMAFTAPPPAEFEKALLKLRLPSQR